MSQTVNTKIKGLYTNPNNLSEVPMGALYKANNIVIDKDSIAETRKGQKKYGDILATSPDKLFNYKNSLVVHYGNKLAYDSNNNGTWVEYSGTYNQPSSNYKMKSVEANRNFYFTTDSGIFKLDALTSTPKLAGAVKGLDGFAILNGASGFMSNNTQIAYRIVWGYNDANHNLILGAPSQRVIIANSSGGTRDTQLTFTIPDSINSDYFYQIYRSNESASSTSEPNDELQLVIEDSPTSAQISALSLTVIDQTPNDLMGAFLYTSPSQEGIANANEIPPFAKDIASFKNHIFYANVKSKQRMFLTTIAVDSPSFGYYVDSTTGTTNGSPILSTIADTSKIRVGMRVVGSGIPSGTTVLNILTSTTLTMSTNATSTASVSVEFQDRVSIAGTDYFGGSSQILANHQFQVYSAATPAENISDTSLDLIEVINKTNTVIYAYYISGYGDLPGKILLEEQGLGGGKFYATSTYGKSFNPILPTSGTSIDSDNSEKINRIYISKTLQPESVPLYSYLDVGSADDEIQRIIGLRDTLFIFKGEGIYRLTGEDQSTFRINLLDGTTNIKAKEAATAFNNQVMLFTNQGVVSCSDSGVQVLSRPIESTLLEVSSDQYINFENISFAVGYESSRQYLLFTGSTKTDTFATQGFVYNSFTNSWTRFVMDRNCAVVSKHDNKLYMGHGSNFNVYQERKSFTKNDYSDEEYAVNITSSSNFIVNLTSTSSCVVGYSLQQDSRDAVIVSIDSSTQITVNKKLSWQTGAGTVNKPINVELEWLPEYAQNPGILKQFREFTLLFKDAAFSSCKVSVNSNFSTNYVSTDLISNSIGDWGTFPFGQTKWGGGVGGAQPLRTFVPLEKQKASWISINVSTKEAFTSFSLAGVSIIFNAITERFK